MKRIKTIILFCTLSVYFYAQDSTKIFSHELGFNTIRIISQFSKLNTQGIAQLPYDVFYNIFYKKKFGIRTGLGMTTSYKEDALNKQPYPKITKSNNINARIGCAYNYSANSRITLTTFSEFIYKKETQESVSSTTAQVFPNPVVTVYEKTATNIDGLGFRLGAGVKLKVYRQLALYMELPFTFMNEKIRTSNVRKETGVETIDVNLTSRHTNSNFTLPATLYLVFSF